MRKALKIILPLVLVLVLLVTAYWFFFLYRKDITAGFFTSLGDGRVEAGDYDGAIRWYQRANRLQPEDTDIALKLADTYHAAGNFTKTEYVLVNAIYASPDCTELYLRLSGVYVEQDKLLDAQLMLDQIHNEDVLKELSAQRPAAPTVTPEGGYYSDRITVSVTPETGSSCYLTTNGCYPSTESDAYTGEIELPLGETTVCAVAVGSDGLVSPAVYVGYTVAGVVEDVDFVDASLEAYLQDQLGRSGRKLKTNELWSVTALDVPEEVTSLADLHYFTGLTSLTIHNVYSDDLAFLAEMPALRTLDLSGCSLTQEQLAAVGGCANLETLRLVGCGLSNLTPLEGLSKLTVLDLSDNSISNLLPLSHLTALQTLLLHSNAISSVTSLSKLTALEVLDLSHNVVKALSPLADCTAMRVLDVSYNDLMTLRGMRGMVNLEVFDASHNQISDVSTLANCKKLRLFTMTDNKLTDIDFLNDIKTIEEVNIDYNDVLAVPSFRDDCALVTFSAAHNFLEDLSGLAGLQTLNYVNADYNNIMDIDVLISCSNLTQINVFGTNVHDGGLLEESGVIVNYTPDVS